MDAGASIVHHHGIHYLEHEMQADGRRLSRIDFDGWKVLTEKIRDACDPIVQFGIASARLEEKFRLMELHPEMMSYAFNVHDEVPVFSYTSPLVWFRYMSPTAPSPTAGGPPADHHCSA